MDNSLMAMPVTTEEEFDAFFAAIEEAACEELKAEKHHQHVAIIVGPHNLKAGIDFDHQVGTQMKIHGSSFDNAKGDVFLAIAQTAYLVRAKGFVEICEGWMAAPPIDGCRTPEQAAEFKRKIVETYGSIEKMPGRGECLLVSGCWEGVPGKRIAWTIKRMGGELLLIDRTCSKSPGDVDRLSWVEQAIAKVYTEEMAK